ncbi:MAG TPA: efflux RND transporter periplasmic adaptor subunit [Gemmatimonadales bacterium]|nr:efflux RND transporter periplasmic adaptor subunit [Gemmatimonadales bacterium]
MLRARLLRASLPVLAAVLAGACKNGDARTPRPNVPVTVATAQARSVPYEISAIGTVTPIQTVAVRAQVTGTITRVAFAEGDEVRAGQLLFQLDARPFQAALDQAVANLARDHAQLVNARAEVSRYQQLVQNDLATQEQFDQFKANADAAQAAVNADSAAVETARLNVEYSTIRSPIAGRTGNLLLKVGNLVPANGTTPLVVINQIHPIAVSFAAPQRYLDDIQRFSARQRLAVEIRPAEDTTVVLRGMLTFLNNQVDTTTGTIQLKATFDNEDRRLWPGEFVAARLVLNVERDVVTVPSEAVMTGQSGTYVYVIGQDRTARTQDVTLGRAVQDYVVIEKGLAAGQTVVTDGQLRLVPGARVEIKPASGDTGAAR